LSSFYLKFCAKLKEKSKSCRRYSGTFAPNAENIPDNKVPGADTLLRELSDGKFKYRCILTNDHESTEVDVIEYYNQRGESESNFWSIQHPLKYLPPCGDS
jgi:hypothetical protein